MAVEADKNIGTTLIQSDIYYSLALDHLRYKTFYSQIDYDPQTKLAKDSSQFIY